MHRIDSNGSTVDHKFTEGNASLSVPATVVSAAIMNDIQEELCNLVETTGATLVKGTQNQILTAVLELIKRGGRSAPIIQSIVNSQSSPADVTGFPVWLSTQIIAMEFLYTITRRTDSENLKETGRCYITWNADLAAWEVSQLRVHDESGVAFVVTPTGTANQFKLQYTSDTISGTSYAAVLRITDIINMRVS